MVKDELRSIGHSGEAGRGNRSTSPSSAARSLAGPAKAKPAAKKPAAKKAEPAAKKAVSKTAPAKKAAAKKAAAAKPSISETTTVKTAPNKAAKKTSAPKNVAASPASGGKPGASESKTGARRSHLRAVPDAPELSAGAQSASETSAKPSSKTEAPPQTALSVEDLVAALISGAQRILGADWERQLATIFSQLRLRISGDYEIDEFGLDPQIAEIFHAAIEPIAEKWFRLEVRGIENIPSDGGALLVANHSGTVPVDGLITSYAVSKHTGRPMRALGADLVFRLPVVGEIARKTGATLACTEDAERLLTSGQLAAVWPEGFKGVGKPFSERYKLQRFGRGGFVSSAMRAQVPIVPVSIVGAEEIYPLIGNIPSLARLFGIPYIPITPFFPLLGPLGLIPLPSKWIIEFGEPVRTDAYAPESADDPMLLFNVTDQVRETIQQTLYKLLYDRGNPFI